MLCGCSGDADAGNGPGIGARYAGFPESGFVVPEDALVKAEPLAGWIDHGATFAVITFGSSSCLATALSIEAEDEKSVLIRLAESTQDPCTADLAPTTYEFTLPEGMDAPPLTVKLAGESGDPTTELRLD